MVRRTGRILTPAAEAFSRLLIDASKTKTAGTREMKWGIMRGLE